MKIISFVFAAICAGAAWAKPDAGLFNQAIREGIQQEARREGVVYKNLGRTPASVEPSQIEVMKNEQQSLDKVEKQYKQIGSPKW